MKRLVLISAAIGGLAVSTYLVGTAFGDAGSGNSAEHRNDDFVVICHYDRNQQGPNAGPHTITINRHALDHHLLNHVKKEGFVGDDSLGACAGDVTPTSTPGTGEPTPTNTPGTGEPTPTDTPGTGEPTPTNTPDTEPTPTNTPGTGEPTPTDTPDTGEPTPTNTPGTGEPTPTDTPDTGEPTPTNTPAIEPTAEPPTETPTLPPD